MLFLLVNRGISQSRASIQMEIGGGHAGRGAVSKARTDTCSDTCLAQLPAAKPAQAPVPPKPVTTVSSPKRDSRKRTRHGHLPRGRSAGKNSSGRTPTGAKDGRASSGCANWERRLSCWSWNSKNYNRLHKYPLEGMTIARHKTDILSFKCRILFYHLTFCRVSSLI